MSENSRVYVVSGRDDLARRSLALFLSAVGLDPVPWPGAQHLLNSARPLSRSLLQEAFDGVQGVVVLLTGDDQGKPNPALESPNSSRFAMSWSLQPTPDLLFEAGLALGAVPERTILVQIGRLRPLNRVWAREVLVLTNAIKSRESFLSHLREIGCVMDVESGRWMDAGNFAVSTDRPLFDEIERRGAGLGVHKEVLPDIPRVDRVFLKQFEGLLRQAISESVSPGWVANRLSMEDEEVETRLKNLAEIGHVKIYKQIGSPKYALSKAGRAVAQEE